MQFLIACLSQDPLSRVDYEAASKTGMIMVLKEIAIKAKLNFQAFIQETVRDIGYTRTELACNALVVAEQQSPDITEGLIQISGIIEGIGVGD
ncbi:methionine adenosyltransferase sam2 [Basidiobolus ranarum]|uniref:Methionine adenosyltransferase sam2 n=1 Tax=Basidiobolus ranarum TaxID=34480 RepID=A0ABR2WWQ7_9FUNG